MESGIILFSKTIEYQKDGVMRSLHIATVQPSKGGTPIEVASSGAFNGGAVFYKLVKAGEELWPGKVADKDTNNYLGSAPISSIQHVKVGLAALAEISFE